LVFICTYQICYLHLFQQNEIDMKNLTIKGQNVKADVLVGGMQELISTTGLVKNYTAIAEVNEIKLTGVQHQAFNPSTGNISVSYTFDGVKFGDSHKKIAEYIYIKYILN
jgi:hypothetical protein